MEFFLGIQCKLYLGPVGKKLSMSFYEANTTTSLTLRQLSANSTYTKSAIELVNKTDVQLLHIEDYQI